MANDQTNGVSFENAADVIGWLEKNNTTDILDQVAAALNHDYPFAFEVFYWIVSQPNCDRATAAHLLINSYSYEAVYLEKIAEKYSRLAAVICRRVEKDGYLISELAHPTGTLNEDPSTLIESIESACVTYVGSIGKALLPIPYKLFSEPFEGRHAKSEFLPDETGMTPISSLPEALRAFL